MTSPNQPRTPTQLASGYAYAKQCTIDEHFARRRRVREFASVTGLECLDWSNKSRTLYDTMVRLWPSSATGCLDHVTIWIDNKGTPYLLFEPYRSDSPGTIDGYVFITVPIPLSPYCGKFSTGEQAVPWTQSFLLCQIAHAKGLAKIEKMLADAALHQPSWNFVGSRRRGR